MFQGQEGDLQGGPSSNYNWKEMVTRPEANV
jgi:hypothetical protein